MCDKRCLMNWFPLRQSPQQGREVSPGFPLLFILVEMLGNRDWPQCQDIGGEDARQAFSQAIFTSNHRRTGREWHMRGFP